MSANAMAEKAKEKGAFPTTYDGSPVRLLIVSSSLRAEGLPQLNWSQVEDILARFLIPTDEGYCQHQPFRSVRNEPLLQVASFRTLQRQETPPP